MTKRGFTLYSRLLWVYGLAALATIVNPTFAWLIAVVSSFLILILSFKTSGALATELLWFVQIEPAPSDLLFGGRVFGKALRGWPKVRLSANHPWGWLSAFLVLGFIEAVFSTDVANSLAFQAITFYTLGVIAYIFAKTDFFVGIGWKRGLAISASITSLILTFLGFIKILGIESEFAFLFDGTRPRALFKDPNVAAPFVIFWVLYLVARHLLDRRFKKREWAYIYILLLGAAFTFSRGAFINLTLGLFVLELIALKKQHFIRALSLLLHILATAIIIIVLAISLGQNRFVKINSYDTQGRLAAWESGLLTFAKKPWGVGPGSFEHYSVRLQKEKLHNAFITPSAHNTYLRVLVENGPLGLALFLMVFVLTFRRLYILVLKTRDPRLLTQAAWLLAALVGILGEGFVIDALHWRHLGIALGLSFYLMDKRGSY